MKLLFFIATFSFCSTSFCQTLQQLDSEIVVLYGKGEYSKAVKLSERSIEIISANGGNKHPKYVAAVYSLGRLYKLAGSYLNAALYYKLDAENNRLRFGESSEEFALSLNQLALLFEELSQYDSAVITYKKAISVFENGPKNSIKYSLVINNLADLFYNIKNYADAEIQYLKFISAVKNKFGDNAMQYATAIKTLANFYYHINKNAEAEKTYLTALDIAKKNNGENDSIYLSYSLGLAEVYQDRQKLNESEKIILSGIEKIKKYYGEGVLYYSAMDDLKNNYILKGEYLKAILVIEKLTPYNKTLGESTGAYLDNLSDLGFIYRLTGQYREAENIYLSLLPQVENVFRKTSIKYANVLAGLAAVYKETNDIQKAEPLFLNALEIRNNILGDNDASNVQLLNNIALLYQDMGQLQKAGNYFVKALLIDKKAAGINTQHYATTLNNYASLLAEAGDDSLAEVYYLKSMEIRKTILSENHPDYAYSLNNLAVFYNNRKNYTKAENYSLQALGLTKKNLTEKSFDYALRLSNLATLYFDEGKYKEAEPLMLQALQIIKDRLGENHSAYITLLHNISAMYQSSGKFSKAEPYALKAFELIKKKISTTFTILSEQEKEAFLNTQLTGLSFFNSLLFNNKNASGAIKSNAYNLQLMLKSMLLSDTRNVLISIQQSTDTAVQHLYSQWKENKKALAVQYALPVESRMSQIKTLEENTEKMEKQLVQYSSSFQQQKSFVNIKSADVQKYLANNEVAIEFVKFTLFNKKFTDSVMYAAYLLKKNDSVPVFIPLCEEKQLQKLFAGAGKTTTALVSSFYRGAGADEDNISVSKGDSLYKLIWQPLEPYLKGINKISYSPAGKLYSIAFNALPAGNGKILMDKYELQQYSSTKQIALRNDINQRSAPKNIALFGDAIFSLDSLQLVKHLHDQPTNLAVSTNIFVSQTRGGVNSVWSNLPGTAEEVKKIQQLFAENKIATKTFIQQNASEENLKTLSGNSPQILHIATHGFFLPEADKKKDMRDANVYSLADDPLIRSGILLAGANYAWSGKAPLYGVEDGIVTAYEISQLDLGKTELVVLSACETALGDIKGSEGVFGLQRSFKMAGVNKLIVSLWQVPDKETSELMKMFYSNWVGGKNIEQAFYLAQREMRKKYSPFYWAAFVLVE